MKILVYGAGAIGGYLGARLYQSGNLVTLVQRAPLAAAMNQEGLTVEEAGEKSHVRPFAAASLAEAFAAQSVYDLIVLSMKSYDLPAARDELEQHDSGAATFLTVGNGIGIEQPFVETFGADRVLAGSLTTPVSKAGPLHLVVERSDRGLALAPINPALSIGAWASLFNEAGIRTATLPDFQAMKWSKAFLNMIGNASSAILGMPPGDIYRDSRLFEMELQMLGETLLVMDALNIPVINIPGSPASTLAAAVRYAPRFLLKPILTRLVAGGRGGKMPSFYLDLVSGRGKSEVVYHNGAVAEVGADLQIATPVNRALNDTLLKLTNGEYHREDFSGQPDRLLAELAAA